MKNHIFDEWKAAGSGGAPAGITAQEEDQAADGAPARNKSSTSYDSAPARKKSSTSSDRGEDDDEPLGLGVPAE